jgi:hypothetical protein
MQFENCPLNSSNKQMPELKQGFGSHSLIKFCIKL